MPTAVMIESNENTMSMIMICRITPEKVAPTASEAAPFSPSSSWWISLVLFHRRKRPPAIRMRSRPEISWRKTEKSGSTSPLIQASRNSRPMRMNMARARPILRARSLLAPGSLSTRMEMKMMLSMPSTSSSAVSVRKAIQACGSDNSSIQVPFTMRQTCSGPATLGLRKLSRELEKFAPLAVGAKCPVSHHDDSRALGDEVDRIRTVLHLDDGRPDMLRARAGLGGDEGRGSQLDLEGIRPLPAEALSKELAKPPFTRPPRAKP